MFKKEDKKYVYNSKKDRYEFTRDNNLTKKEKIFYVELFEKLCKLMSDECYKDGYNKKQRIKALEDNLLKVIQKYPELLFMKKYNINHSTVGCETLTYYNYSITFLYEVAFYKLYNVIEQLCVENLDICSFPTFDKRKLFFDIIPEKPNAKYQHSIDEYNAKRKLTLSLLEKHPALLYLKDGWGENFANIILRSYSSDSEFIKPFMPYILKSLNNTEIATQKDYYGCNLGMVCALKKDQELFDIAYQNPKARLQKNNDGETMEMIANNNGLIVPPLTDEQVYEFYNERMNKKIEDICK